MARLGHGSTLNRYQLGRFSKGVSQLTGQFSVDIGRFIRPVPVYKLAHRSVRYKCQPAHRSVRCKCQPATGMLLFELLIMHTKNNYNVRQLR